MSALAVLRVVPVVILGMISAGFGLFSLAVGEVERGLQSLGGAAILFALAIAYVAITRVRAKQIQARLDRNKAAKAAQQQQHHQQYYPQQHAQQWPGQAHGHPQQQWHGQPQHGGWHGAPQGYPQQHPQQPYHPPYPPQH
ncbi:hypothetical protein O4J56_27395 [Nocardiopsis sp. RSe5-2]|uniref:Uncharacterized protein n=1 Tax=Nocardiopsis endophytica TaxID=3018445 RepID=A0ABT4UBY9_9ACTN|nr:hypothetical protein [Nocardiopsis endophytica]MDA2814402.1 hypothetical protein [Nocardiopsis endophytica]